VQTTYGYGALSRRNLLTRPNGIATSYGYDPASNLLSVLHKMGTTVLDGATYTVDPVGNRKTRTDKRTNVSLGYGYDNIYQLKTAKQGTTTKESYTYDLEGNRLSSLGVNPYNYNTSNELTSTPSGNYTYDNNGSRKSDPSGAQYNWDYENRLTQEILAGTGGTVMFKYDPFGRRAQKAFTQNGTTTTTNYFYDGLNILETTDQGGNVVARYTDSLSVDEPLSELVSGTASYYEQDGLGSVSSLSNVAGALANTYTYDSYGRLTASTGTLTNPFQYTGREFDQETGIYFYRARYFDPSIGRFISEDPIVFNGSGTNFYAYVWNSPIALFDPLGFVGIEKPTTQQLGSLAALFPGAYVDYSNRNVVVPMPCADVQKILEQNGFATANNTDVNAVERYFLFGRTSDHPTGTQVRHMPTRPTDPDPNSNVHLVLEDTHQTCPDNSCTMTGAHNDPHNPLSNWLSHLFIDYIPYKFGF